MKVLALWLARKALYVLIGSALGALTAYVLQNPDLNSWTLSGAMGGLGASVVGDLRRKLLPDLLQIVTGEDPRSDG